MAKEPVCLVCQKVMEPGVMREGATGGPRWSADAPATPKRGGSAVVKRRSEGAAVVAFRCPECKALRLYAPDPA